VALLAAVGLIGDNIGIFEVALVRPLLVLITLPNTILTEPRTLDPTPNKVTMTTRLVAAVAAVGAFALGCGGGSGTSQPTAPAGGIGSVRITAGTSTPRQGDVVHYDAEATDGQGRVVPTASVAWSVVGPAQIEPDGRFVGNQPGPVRIIATVSGRADTLDATISPRNGPVGSFTVVGRGIEDVRGTTDLWVHGDFAYLGTQCGSQWCGDRLFVWDISNPAAPIRVDSMIADAVRVNDVKIRADGAIGVLTHEGSVHNGITLFDLGDPAHPAAITRYVDGLGSGVHNVWIEDDYVYAVHHRPGTPDGGELRIIDISDPENPITVATFFGGSSHPHDVYVRDGLAFVSHWDAGLIILDVGSGLAGGSPANPVEVGRVHTRGGKTHNAWYWPEAGYVFVGEEDGSARGGMIHIVDAHDLSNPVEIASFDVGPSNTPHNFWMDEERGILYAAWYQEGILAIDVSGELLGPLHLQRRQIAHLNLFEIAGGPSPVWAPQLHGGLLYLSDTSNGLWVLAPTF